MGKKKTSLTVGKATIQQNNLKLTKNENIDIRTLDIKVGNHTMSIDLGSIEDGEQPVNIEIKNKNGHLKIMITQKEE